MQIFRPELKPSGSLHRLYLCPRILYDEDRDSKKRICPHAPKRRKQGARETGKCHVK